jgi:hypothetical protein
MTTDPADQSANKETEKTIKPIEELFAKDDEKHKKVEELIREAERKSKPILDPEM